MKDKIEKILGHEHSRNLCKKELLSLFTQTMEEMIGKPYGEHTEYHGKDGSKCFICGYRAAQEELREKLKKL